jgi:hypothetical protein
MRRIWGLSNPLFGFPFAIPSIHNPRPKLPSPPDNGPRAVGRPPASNLPGPDTSRYSRWWLPTPLPDARRNNDVVQQAGFVLEIFSALGRRFEPHRMPLSIAGGCRADHPLTTLAQSKYSCLHTNGQPVGGQLVKPRRLAILSASFMGLVRGVAVDAHSTCRRVRSALELFR